MYRVWYWAMIDRESDDASSPASRILGTGAYGDRPDAVAHPSGGQSVRAAVDGNRSPAAPLS